MTERYFVQGDFPELPVYEGTGLLVSGIKSTTWNPKGVEPVEEFAMALRSNEHVMAISAVDGRPVDSMDGLALAFSRHLRHTRRSKNGFNGPACVTSIAPPLPPQKCVRMPHLVTIRSSSILDDTVVWEMQTEREAEEWLGAPLSNQNFVEGNLGKIMKLRQEIRSGKPATSEQEKEFQYNLSKGRYLSILFVYQHIELFKAMFDESN